MCIIYNYIYKSINLRMIFIFFINIFNFYEVIKQIFAFYYLFKELIEQGLFFKLISITKIAFTILTFELLFDFTQQLFNR